MKSIKGVNISGRRVLVRVDFNVPVKNGVVVDDFRIRSCLPTIKYLLKNKAIVVLLSHFGRPNGKVKPEFSLSPVAKKLGELLKKNVIMTDDCISLNTVKIVSNACVGDVVLLENLRFYSEEESNDLRFAEKLSLLGDVFVNDAFSASHRAHASIVSIPRFLPSFAGFGLENEVKQLSRLFSARRPFVVVLGGAKVGDKIGVIKNLIDKATYILVGGAMVFTFFKAMNLEVGKSFFEPEKIDVAKELLNLAGDKLVFPIDIIVAKDSSSKSVVVPFTKIEKDLIGFDIGPDACFNFAQIIRNAKTVFWNGPLGLFEKKPFDKGTVCVADSMVKCRGFTVIGGGETISAVRQLNLEKKISFVSSGGGASLEFLSGKKLPGIIALNEKL